MDYTQLIDSYLRQSPHRDVSHEVHFNRSKSSRTDCIKERYNSLACREKWNRRHSTILFQNNVGEAERKKLLFSMSLECTRKEQRLLKLTKRRKEASCVRTESNLLIVQANKRIQLENQTQHIFRVWGEPQIHHWGLINFQLVQWTVSRTGLRPDSKPLRGF